VEGGRERKSEERENRINIMRGIMDRTWGGGEKGGRDSQTPETKEGKNRGFKERAIQRKLGRNKGEKERGGGHDI
jgi:hypothetical protein